MEAGLFFSRTFVPKSIIQPDCPDSHDSFHLQWYLDNYPVSTRMGAPGTRIAQGGSAHSRSSPIFTIPVKIYDLHIRVLLAFPGAGWGM